ncbi:MAG TPA: OmpH family outer membrane protein [Pirellulales bacterium]|nr:OmpH family outer membrane protein [Pirellulales bacterium]
MAKSLCRGTFAALFTALALTSTAHSQQQPAGQPPQQPPRNATPPAGGAPAGGAAHHAAAQHGGAVPGGVALIDLPYVLKNHGGFNHRLEELRREAEGAENALKIKRDEIQKLMVQLDDLNRGSPDFKKLEEEITKRQAGLSVDVNITKKKFQEAEAKIYYEVYQSILAEVRYYAEANRITLVLKFNGDEANKDNPEEIMREMQKMVLYYNPVVDITPIILDRMKAQQPRGAAGTNPAAQRPGVQQPPRR